MLIAQLTDLHALPEGRKLDGIIDTNAMLSAAVNALRLLPQSPDLVVLSGDLSEDGSAESYQALRDRLAPLEAPILPIAGNHDRRDALRNAFSDLGLFPPDGPLHYSLDAGPLCFIALDTLEEGRGGGRLDRERLKWLEKTLHAAVRRETVIVMHHPPFASGIHWMDAAGFEGLGDFQNLIRGRTHVRSILCGHLHRSMSSAISGVPAIAAPSTCYQLHLDFSPTAEPQINLERPAYCLHRWSDGLLVTHVQPVHPDAPIPVTSESWRRKAAYARALEDAR